MTINVDFDATVVVQSFPLINKADIGSAKVLRELITNGHRLILFTVRWDCPVDPEKNYLTQR